MRIGVVSERMTTPGQIEQLSPIATSPISSTPSAIMQFLPIVGRLPLKG